MSFQYRKLDLNLPSSMAAVAVTKQVIDDTDVTLCAELGFHRFIGAIPAKQNFNSATYVDLFSVNATGTSVVANCSTKTASATGDVEWWLFFTR